LATTANARRGAVILLAVISLPLWGPSAALDRQIAALRDPDWRDPDWRDPDWVDLDWRSDTLAVAPDLRVADIRAGDKASVARHGDPAATFAPGRRSPSPLIGLPNFAVQEHTLSIASDHLAQPLAHYLIAVGRAESNLDTFARSPGSSAAGRFQFVEQTWLLTMRRYGQALGLAREARLIRLAADGHAVVADPAARADLLALRFDPRVSTALVIALTRENARVLQANLGRSPTDAELYAAHLLGAGQAIVLLSANHLVPDYPAATIFPVAARSNPSLFYAGRSPRSVCGLLALIERKMDPYRDERPGVPRGPNGNEAATNPASSPAADELVNRRTESASY
jgi:hypothetical protein